jgi:hypothetical protein
VSGLLQKGLNRGCARESIRMKYHRVGEEQSSGSKSARRRAKKIENSIIKNARRRNEQMREVRPLAWYYCW